MYRKELAYYFSSPVAYIVVGLYLVAVSLFLWVIPGEWNIVESGYAQADGLFQLSPWFLMLLCPALTMRLFAEERQTGTWNLLIAKKIPVWVNVDGAQFAGSMIGLLFLSMSFTAIGLTTASMTRSQIVAFILGTVVNFVLYWLLIQSHYTSISRGVIDLRDVVFFLSVAAIGIILTIVIIERITRR